MSHLLFKILNSLDEAGVHFTLARTIADSVLVSATIPGMRVEIYVYEGGELEYSTFVGDESVSTEMDQLGAMLERVRVENST